VEFPPHSFRIEKVIMLERQKLANRREIMIMIILIKLHHLYDPCRCFLLLFQPLLASADESPGEV